MYKKIQLALLLSCMGTSSFAYQVKAYLTIDNKTNVPMQIGVKQPYNQPEIIKDLPPHTVTQVTKDPMENGMSYLFSLSQSYAFFAVKGIAENKDKVYLQGRVVYFAGGGASEKYSFIDNLSTAKGLTSTPAYTCRSAEQADHIFNNQIVIEGTPGDTLVLTPFSDETGYCQGLKTSIMRDGDGEGQKNQYYTPVCFDGTTSIFWRVRVGDRFGDYPAYQNGKEAYDIGDLSPYEPSFKSKVDEWVGNRYCETWSNEIHGGGN